MVRRRMSPAPPTLPLRPPYVDARRTTKAPRPRPRPIEPHLITRRVVVKRGDPGHHSLASIVGPVPVPVPVPWASGRLNVMTLSLSVTQVASSGMVDFSAPSKYG